MVTVNRTDVFSIGWRWFPELFWWDGGSFLDVWVVRCSILCLVVGGSTRRAFLIAILCLVAILRLVALLRCPVLGAVFGRCHHLSLVASPRCPVFGAFCVWCPRHLRLFAICWTPLRHVHIIIALWRSSTPPSSVASTSSSCSFVVGLLSVLGIQLLFVSRRKCQFASELSSEFCAIHSLSIYQFIDFPVRSVGHGRSVLWFQETFLRFRTVEAESRTVEDKVKLEAKWSRSKESSSRDCPHWMWLVGTCEVTVK